MADVLEQRLNEVKGMLLGATGISEGTRQLIVGYIDGILEQEGYINTMAPMEELRYALSRASRIASLSGLRELGQVKSEIRETLGPYLKKEREQLEK